MAQENKDKMPAAAFSRPRKNRKTKGTKQNLQSYFESGGCAAKMLTPMTGVGSGALLLHGPWAASLPSPCPFSCPFSCASPSPPPCKWQKASGKRVVKFAVKQLWIAKCHFQDYDTEAPGSPWEPTENRGGPLCFHSLF